MKKCPVRNTNAPETTIRGPPEDKKGRQGGIGFSKKIFSDSLERGLGERPLLASRKTVWLRSFGEEAWLAFRGREGSFEGGKRLK